jgi:hypothetical protein
MMLYKLQHHRVRQSAKLFSSRRSWDSQPHTRWRERGWESPNSDEGTYTLVRYSVYISSLCAARTGWKIIISTFSIFILSGCSVHSFTIRGVEYT